MSRRDRFRKPLQARRSGADQKEETHDAHQDHRFLRRNRQRGRRDRARAHLRPGRRRGRARLRRATAARTRSATRRAILEPRPARCSATPTPPRHVVDRPLDPRGARRARRARAGRRDRVLLGLAHRQGPRLDRQLRPAPARRRPHRRRDRARRPRRATRAGAPRRRRRRRRRRRARDRRGRSPLRSAPRSRRSPTRTPTCSCSTRAPSAAQGRVSLSSSAEHLIEIADAARCSCCRAASACEFGGATSGSTRRRPSGPSAAPDADAREASSGRARPAGRARRRADGRRGPSDRRASARETGALAVADPATAARYRGGRAGRRSRQRSPSSATRACASRSRSRRRRSRGASSARARQLGRELKLPGFRKGKVPAPLVIQRMGREAMLEEARARHRSRAGTPRRSRAPASCPSATRSVDLDFAKLPAEGRRRSSSRSRSACCRRPSSATTRASRSAAREPRRSRSSVDAGARGDARAPRAPGDGRAPRPSGDFVVIDYVGSLRLDDGALEPFAGGEGRDQLVELGSGNLIPGFEEGLLGATAGEDAHASRSASPPTTPTRELAGRDAELRGDRQGGQGEGAPRARRRLRDRRRLRRPRGAARRHPRAAARGASAARVQAEFRQAALDAAVANAKVASHPRARHGARAGRCGSGCCTRSPTAASRARPTCRSAAATRRRSSPSCSPRPSRRCAARP